MPVINQGYGHRLWGNEASVLAGDFLFAQSFDLMVETNSLEALSSLSKASCKITQGEFKQMQISNNPNTKIDDYFAIVPKNLYEKVSVNLGKYDLNE